MAIDNNHLLKDINPENKIFLNHTFGINKNKYAYEKEQSVCRGKHNVVRVFFSSFNKAGELSENKIF